MNLALALAAGTVTSTAAGVSAPFALRQYVEDVRFRVALGGEWDTNAPRAVEGAAAPERAPMREADALVRVLVDAHVGLRFAPEHHLMLSYLLGAKRFFEVTSQDLLAHEFFLETRHRLSPASLLRISARGRSHRVRDDRVRDYDLGVTRTSYRFRLGRMVDLEMSASVSGYRYPEQPFFSYWSPSAQVGITVLPTRRWRVSASAGYAHRDYAGPGLVQTFPVDLQANLRGNPFPTFCVRPDPTLECTKTDRTDDEVRIDTEVTYHGRLLGGTAIFAGSRYILRSQRSTSDYENVDRHRASLFATINLPLSLTFSILATVQLNDGTSLTDTLTLAEDDENRNMLQAKLTHRLSDPVSVELRYALFANQFSTADVRYGRQTIYLGLAFETGP